jgi:hypothetical protein
VADSCKHGNERLGSIKCVQSLLRGRPLLTSHGSTLHSGVGFRSRMVRGTEHVVCMGRQESAKMIVLLKGDENMP